MDSTADEGVGAREIGDVCAPDEQIDIAPGGGRAKGQAAEQPELGVGKSRFPSGCQPFHLVEAGRPPIRCDGVLERTPLGAGGDVLGVRVEGHDEIIARIRRGRSQISRGALLTRMFYAHTY